MRSTTSTALVLAVPALLCAASCARRERAADGQGTHRFPPRAGGDAPERLCASSESAAGAHRLSDATPGPPSGPVPRESERSASGALPSRPSNPAVEEFLAKHLAAHPLTDRSRGAEPEVAEVVKAVGEAAARRFDERGEEKGAQGREWRAHFFEDEKPAVWCLPGGHVGVSTGVFRFLDKKGQRRSSELAALVAHAVAHELLRREAAAPQPVVRGVSPEPLLPAGLDPQIWALAGSPTRGAEEKEADRLALSLVAAARQDPRRYPAVWSRLAEPGNGEPAGEFLAVHPWDEERKRRVEEMMPGAKEIFLEQYPHAVLGNGTTRIVMFLPDPEKGWYRDTRFDWSGIVTQAEHMGHTYFGEFDLGTPEQFGQFRTWAPAREAGLGETFFGIGIGYFEKYEEGGDATRVRTRLVRPADWRISRGADSVEFVQELGDAHGRACVYTKRVALDPGRPVLTIAHAVRNTGAKPIETNHYCHNFFFIDETYPGPDYHMTFARPPKAKTLDESARLEGKEIFVVRGDIWGEFVDFTSAEENDVVLANTKTGAAVRIRGDYVPERYNLYVKNGRFCPEPYADVKVAPGEERRWTNEYTFFVVEAR